MKVKVGNATSRLVEIRTELKKDDALSPIIFNLILKKRYEKWKLEEMKE